MSNTYDSDINLNARTAQLLTGCFSRHSAALNLFIQQKQVEAIQPLLAHLNIDATPIEQQIEGLGKFDFRNSQGEWISLKWPTLEKEGIALFIGKWPPSIKNNHHVIRFLRNYFPEFNNASTQQLCFPPVLILGNGHIKAVDAAFEIKLGKRENIALLRKTFLVNRRKKSCVLHAEYTKPLSSEIFSLVDHLKSSTDFWKEEGTETLWLMKKGKSVPYAKILKPKNGRVNRVQAVNSNWRRMKRFLTLLPAQHPLYHLFPVEDVKVWCKEDKVVDWIEDWKTEIRLERADEYFVYAENKDYGVVNDESILSLFPGSIALEKITDPSKKGLILPLKLFTAGGFKTVPVQQTIKEKHFFYALNPKTGLWQGSSQLAQFYLIYFLKSQGQYEKAYEYLHHFHYSTAFDESQLDLLLHILTDNQDVRNLSLAIQAYIKYLDSKAIAISSSTRYSKLEKNLHALAQKNVVALQNLMGSDFSLNRLHFSPTLQDVQKITNSRSVYSSPVRLNNPLIALIPRWKSFFSQIAGQRSSSVTLFTNFLTKIKGVHYKVKANDRGIKKWSKAFIYENKNTKIIDFESLYAKIINAEGSEHEMLELDFSILIERYRKWDGESQSINFKNSALLELCFLYWILNYRGSFYQAFTNNDFSLNNLAQFLNLINEGTEYLHRNALQIVYPEAVVSENENPALLSSLPERQPPQFYPLNAKRWEQDIPWQSPLKSIFNDFFTSSPEPIHQEESSAFNFHMEFEAGSLERARMQQLSAAYAQVPQTYEKYTLNDSMEDLQAELEATLKHTQNKTAELEAHIQNLLEGPTDEELSKMTPQQQIEIYEIRRSYTQEKRERPDLHKHLLPSLYLQAPEIIEQVNPFLLKSNLLPRLYDLGMTYMLKCSKIDQIQEALEYIKTGQTQKAGEVLVKERLYNPFEYPEILMYEYSTGLMLRNKPDQAKLLQRIIQTVFGSSDKKETRLRRLFHEFQAGGGKTKVISAILAARGFKEGKTVVFFGLFSQLDVVRADLGNTLQLAYQLGSTSLKFGLGDRISLDMAKNIYSLLSAKRLCLIMDPETWHSLHLQWQQAVAEGFIDLAQELNKILNHFKTQSLFIIDEEHRNISSMVEANIAAGTPSSYPGYARKLVIQIQNALFGWLRQPLRLADGSYLHEAINLASDGQASATSENKQAIIQRLAAYILKKITKIPSEFQADFIEYLTNKNQEAPSYLCDLRQSNDEKAKELASQIDLAKGLLCFVLPLAWSKKLITDYAPSPDASSDLFDPCILGEATGQKYQHTDVAAILTAQGIMQLGLNARQMKGYLTDQITQYKKAANSASLLNEKFRKMNPPRQLSELEERDLENPALIENFCSTVGKEPQAINWFLERALRQINIYPYKLYSTSQELSVGANAVFHTSATMGSLEENPWVEEENFTTMDTFAADVIQRALSPHNAQTVWSAAENPLSMLEDLYKRGIDFSYIDGVINVGGLYQEYNSEKWAQALFDFNRKHKMGYEAVIIAKTQLKEDSLEKKLFIIRQGYPDEAIEGSDVKSALKRLRLEDKRVFKVYSSDMTTGTDLLLDPQAKMIVTVGENVSLSAYIQAIMRMRGFLSNPVDQKNSQSLVWIGQQNFAHFLADRFHLDKLEPHPQHILGWSVVKEAEHSKAAIQMRATQDIEMVIRSIVKQIIENNPHLSDQHKNAHEAPLGYNPTRDYGAVTKLKDTEKFLWKHANNFAKEAHIDLDSYPEAKNRIANNIKQVKAKIAKIESSSTQNLAAFTHQHQNQNQSQNQQQQQQQQQQNIDSQSHLAADEVDKESCFLSINPPEDRWKANHLLETEMFSPTLYLSPGFFNVEQALESPKLKPASFFMLTLRKDKDGQIIDHDYRVLSSWNTDYNQQALTDSSIERLQEGIFHTGTIFTIYGDIYQADRAPGGLSEEEIFSWKQTPEFQRILAEIGLINAQVIRPEIQQTIVRENKEIRINELRKIWNYQVYHNQDHVENLEEALLSPTINKARPLQIDQPPDQQPLDQPQLDSFNLDEEWKSHFHNSHPIEVEAPEEVNAQDPFVIPSIADLQSSTPSFFTRWMSHFQGWKTWQIIGGTGISIASLGIIPILALGLTALYEWIANRSKRTPVI